MTARDWLFLTDTARLSIAARGRNGKVASIIEAVCRESGHSRDDMLGARRTKDLAQARQLAMHIAWQHCPWLSSTAIGRLFKRDHTTVLSNCKVVDKRLATCGETVLLRLKVLRRLGLEPEGEVMLKVVK